MNAKPSPSDFDEGIRDAVLMLWKAGFKTFTCCEGGRGHAFQHPTIGLRFTGDYFRFRDRLAKFLVSHGCEVFEISLMSCYHPSHRKPKNLVYLESLDLLSPERRKRRLAAIRRRDKGLQRSYEALLGTSSGR